MTRVAQCAGALAAVAVLSLFAVPCRAETAIDFSTGVNYMFHKLAGNQPNGSTFGVAVHFGPELHYEGDTKDDLKKINTYGTVEAYYFDDSNAGTEIRNFYLDLGGRAFADVLEFKRNSLYVGGSLALLATDVTFSGGSTSSDDSAWLFGFKALAGWEHEFSKKHRLFAELYYRGYLHYITGSIDGLAASDYNNAGLTVGYRLRLGAAG
jgi:hypothetical protein